jgi:hypothetical protein
LRRREILDRVQQLWKLVLPAGLGLAVASITGISGLEDASWYLLTISALLAIGLYGSTYSIDLRAARQDWRLILAAVTIGVIVKAALIGLSLALLWRDPLFLVLGVAVAQIDPLAVASILDNPRMSPRAKSILAAWSSFDDPITVILAVYAATIVASAKGIHLAHAAWQKDLLLNVVFAAGAWVLWLLVRRWEKAVLVLAVVLLGVAVWQFTFLGLAIAGLFVAATAGPRSQRRRTAGPRLCLVPPGAAPLRGRVGGEGDRVGARGVRGSDRGRVLAHQPPAVGGSRPLGVRTAERHHRDHPGAAAASTVWRRDRRCRARDPDDQLDPPRGEQGDRPAGRVSRLGVGFTGVSGVTFL